MALSNIYDQFEGEPQVYLTTTAPTYRDRIATIQEYKGNRAGKAKPKWYRELREYVTTYHGAIIRENMEADDAVGIEQWKHKDKSTCIVSLDKDLDCIPGHHYNYVKDKHYYLTLPEADKHFWKQVLTGDTSDHIRGIPKVGPKTADKILEGKNSWIDMHQAVGQAYAKAGIENELYENCSLLWIQRNEGVNYDGRPYREVEAELQESGD